MTTFISRRFLLGTLLLCVSFLIFSYASPAEASDIEALNALPVEGTKFYTTDTITFLGTVHNLVNEVVPEAGYADIQIDWNSDGGWIHYNANPNSDNKMGSLSPNGTKQLQEVLSNPPLGTHRYRFIVDTAGDLPGDTNPANNISPWVSFTVIPVPVAPTIITFSATPNPITLGGSATLNWTVTDATSCTGSNGSAGWSGAKNASSDSQSVSPLVTTLYTMSCTGTGGSATKSFTVDVVTPAPTVTLTPSANPINSGTPVTLTWSTTNAHTCTASDGWSGAKGIGNSEVVSPLTTTVYTLDCTGAGGATSKTQTISVNNSLPGITITATLSPVVSGGATTLNWSVTDATSCTGASGWSGTKAVPSGSQVVNPTILTTYRLTCTGPAGISSKEVTVAVTGLPDLIPRIWMPGQTRIYTSVKGDSLNPLTEGVVNTFQGQVQNNGTVATPTGFKDIFTSKWGWTTPGPAPAYVNRTALGPGEIYLPYEESPSFTPDKSGLLEAIYCVDVQQNASDPLITEQDEKNNCATRVFNVQSAPGTPSLNFILSPSSLTTPVYMLGNSVIGSTSTLSWNVTGATSCTGVSSPFDPRWNGAKNTVSGSVDVTPYPTTNYSLSCTGLGGTIIKAVRINVQVAIPTVSLSASLNPIVRGTATVLSWVVSSARSCTGTSNPNDSAWNGDKNRISDSFSASPSVSTTYTLTCESPIAAGYPGGTTIRSIRVDVTDPPPTVSLTASFNPITTVATDVTTITWTPHDATGCTGTSNPNDATSSWNGAKNFLGGTLDVSPEVTTTYTLICNGQGTDFATTHVTISVVSTAPIINSSLNKTIITKNIDTAIFTWNVRGANSCTGVSVPSDPNWDTFNFNANFDSSKTVSPSVTTTYSINCSGPWGATVGAKASLNVVPKAIITKFKVCIAGTEGTAGERCAFSGGTLEGGDVNPGTPLEVFWDSVDATFCEAVSGYKFSTGNDPTDGKDTAATTPYADSRDTYTLVCGSLNRLTSDYISIYVHTNNVVPSIRISPKIVESGGGYVDVMWDTNNGDQTLCSIKGGGLTYTKNLLGMHGETGSVLKIPILGKTKFVITCPSKVVDNNGASAGGTESATTTVELSPRIWGR